MNHNTAHLYDAVNLSGLQRQIIPYPVGATGYMPFLNPPFLAALLAPLALLNINAARLLWLGISIALAVFIILKLIKPLQSKQKILAVSLLLMTFPLYQTFIEGQVSILVLFSACVSYLFFMRKQKLFSGASLVLLWILPQFGVFTIIGLVYKRQWQMLKGWFIATLAIFLATIPVTGIKIYSDYVKLLINTTGNHFIDMNTSAKLRWRGALNTSSGLNGFYDSLVGPGHTMLVNILYLATSGMILLGLAYTLSKVGKKWTASQEALLFSAVILITCIINPHLYAQDAIVIYLLLPALFTLYRHNFMKCIILLAAVSDLIYLDLYSRLHFFVTFLIISLLYLLITFAHSIQRPQQLKD